MFPRFFARDDDPVRLRDVVAEMVTRRQHELEDHAQEMKEARDRISVLERERVICDAMITVLKDALREYDDAIQETTK